MKLTAWLFVMNILGFCLMNAAIASPYAVSVIDFYNTGSGPNIDPSAALGAPDSVDDDTGLYSMGAFGWLELELGQPVLDLAGNDFAVWEESTFFDFAGSPDLAFPDEDVDVYLSFDATNWVLIGEARRGIAGSLVYDIAGKNVEGATYARIVDVSGGDSFLAEGFDLDAVTIYEAAPVPIPTAVWMLGGALGVLGWLRRRLATCSEYTGCKWW